jgi:hypothetical protein
MTVESITNSVSRTVGPDSVDVSTRVESIMNSISRIVGPRSIDVSTRVFVSVSVSRIVGPGSRDVSTRVESMTHIVRVKLFVSVSVLVTVTMSPLQPASKYVHSLYR